MNKKESMDVAKPISTYQSSNLTIVPIFNALILVGAMLTAIQLRLILPLGKNIDLNSYDQQYSFLLSLILVSVLVSQITAVLADRVLRTDWLMPQRQYRTLLIAIILATGLIVTTLPDVSQLQALYFFFGAVILGAFVIVYPGRLRKGAYYYTNTVVEDLTNLYKARESIFVWLKYRIMARYSQAALGFIWIVMQPLLMALVMSFAFTQLLGARSIGVPFIIFLLSGLTLFDLFGTVVNKSTRTLIANGGLIKQVYFPREIAVILDLGEAAVDTSIGILVFIVISITYGIYPNIYYLLIPIPLFFLVCLATGLAFFCSWLGLIVRDLQQLIGVILRLLFYLTVLHRGEPSGNFAFFVLFNPMLGIVEVFRDIVLYARMPDFTVLFLSGTLSVAVLYVGYVFFKVREDRFADYV